MRRNFNEDYIEIIDEDFTDCSFDILIDGNYLDPIDLFDYIETDYIADIETARKVKRMVEKDYPDSVVEINKHCWDEDNHYKDELIEVIGDYQADTWTVDIYSSEPEGDYLLDSCVFDDEREAKAFARSINFDENKDYPDCWAKVNKNDLNEDTVKTSKGKWTNKGDSGKTHGTFTTKKAADAQRKAMFANGYKTNEDLNEIEFNINEAYGSTHIYDGTIEEFRNDPDSRDWHTKELVNIDGEEYHLMHNDETGKDLLVLNIREGLKRKHRKIKESMEPVISEEVKPLDIFDQYVYVEDIDGKKIPSWILLDKISQAVNISAEELLNVLYTTKNSYKLYRVDAPNFSRIIIAAKEVDPKEIEEEFADYLLGKSIIAEIIK